jgi:non-specific serine/threonine protein kinase
LREKAAVRLENNDREILLEEIPFLIGAEYLDGHWLDCAWDKLHQVYEQEIKKHAGSINEYFRNLNPDIHVAGKVYFHLVESQREDYPFAFLATYAAESQTGGAAKHLPLKNALREYGENSRKLLELLATVNKAAGQSAFVSELLERGEIFHPIGLNPDEAYKKNIGQYGRFDNAAKYIDPREE